MNSAFSLFVQTYPTTICIHCVMTLMSDSLRHDDRSEVDCFSPDKCMNFFLNRTFDLSKVRELSKTKNLGVSTDHPDRERDFEGARRPKLSASSGKKVRVGKTPRFVLVLVFLWWYRWQNVSFFSTHQQGRVRFTFPFRGDIRAFRLVYRRSNAGLEFETGQARRRLELWSQSGFLGLLLPAGHRIKTTLDHLWQFSYLGFFSVEEIGPTSVVSGHHQDVINEIWPSVWWSQELFWPK